MKEEYRMRKHIALLSLLLVLLMGTVGCTNAPQQTLATVSVSKPQTKLVHRTAIPTPILKPTPTPGVPPMLRNISLFHGNEQLPEIALTFDDGPSPVYTEQILQILQNYHIHATFFEIGQQVQGYPQVAREVIAAGNVIGNHTWNHPQLTLLTAAQLQWQINTTNQTIQQVTGQKPFIMRPPYGSINTIVHTQLEQMGFLPVLWNIDTVDWSLPGTASIINTAVSQARNGAIILMHDGGGNRSETVAALPTIITTLQQRGFRFVTIPEMLAHNTTTGQYSTASPASVFE
jgi:peptidoglycan/xylan/chitin deacetylase (PgdA/CDA1 family)